MEPVPLGPRPQAGEARHGCWEESPLPGMRPTGRWDRSRLKGEKGPLGAVGAPEPSLCAGSLSASPPRARSPPGARSPHARCATAMAPTACSRAGTTRSGPCPRGRRVVGGRLLQGTRRTGSSRSGGAPRGGVPGGRTSGVPGCEASLFCSCATARRPSLEPAPMRGDASGDWCYCDASCVGRLRAGAVPCGSAHSAKSRPSAQKVTGVGLEPATSSF